MQDASRFVRRAILAPDHRHVRSGGDPVSCAVETPEGNKARVTVFVVGAAFETDIDEAFKRVALQLNMPGFGPGKAPPQSCSRPRSWVSGPGAWGSSST